MASGFDDRRNSIRRVERTVYLDDAGQFVLDGGCTSMSR
jgi:hypothetical protein